MLKLSLTETLAGQEPNPCCSRYILSLLLASWYGFAILFTPKQDNKAMKMTCPTLLKGNSACKKNCLRFSHLCFSVGAGGQQVLSLALFSNQSEAVKHCCFAQATCQSRAALKGRPKCKETDETHGWLFGSWRQAALLKPKSSNAQFIQGVLTLPQSSPSVRPLSRRSRRRRSS